MRRKQLHNSLWRTQHAEMPPISQQMSINYCSPQKKIGIDLSVFFLGDTFIRAPIGKIFCSSTSVWMGYQYQEVLFPQWAPRVRIWIEDPDSSTVICLYPSMSDQGRGVKFLPTCMANWRESWIMHCSRSCDEFNPWFSLVHEFRNWYHWVMILMVCLQILPVIFHVEMD